MRRMSLVQLVMAIAAAAWAGQEYQAQPGDLVRSGELIVRLKPGAAATVILGYLPRAQITPLNHLNLFHVQAALLPASVSSLLAADGLVDFVEPNRVRHANVGPPNDADFSQQWPLANLGAVQAWTVFPNQFLTAATAGTGRIKVAVLDTGIDCTHPDFMNLGATSTDSALGGQILWSAGHAPVATTLSSPTCPWQDDYGHGTHVSGIIAAAANNGIGVAGLAYPVQLVAYKILDDTGSGTDVTIADAIMSAADAGIPIISLSLGGAGYSQTLQLAVNYAWQRNSLVVAAAGNSASSAIFYPADANFAVGVSATDINSNFASFSNFGNGVAIAGPGVSVFSTLPAYAVPLSSSTGYGSLSGTSMATPHVSAVAGLVETTTPGTSAAAILLRLQQTATSTTVGGGWNQDFGYGIVNAYNAVSGTLRTAVSGGVTGQVTDSIANPIANATVAIGGSSVTTDASGLFRLPNLAPGMNTVQVSAGSFATQNLTVTVPAGADARFPVMMGVGYGNFTGMVTDHGVGVPNAVVQAISANLIQGTAITDTSGNYTLWAPAGTYNLLVTNIGDANTTVANQTIASGGTATVNLTIARFGSISGTVISPSGAAMASATVSITGGIFPITLTTGANGQFSASGLASGTYTVTCSEFGFAITTVSGLVIAPETVTNGSCQLGTLQQGWYSASWSDRKPITLAHTRIAGGANLINFTVLVSLSSDANLAATALAGGNDIVFTAGDGLTLLNYEIESFSRSTGQLIAWVQLPILSAVTDTTIYMYYGNSSPPPPPSPSLTWDANYKGVWHLGNGAVLSAADSTATGNNGAINGATAAAGEIGGAGNFTPSGANVNLGGGSTGGGTNGNLDDVTFTWYGWIYTSDTTNYKDIFTAEAGGLPGLRLNNSNQVEYEDVNSSSIGRSAGVIPANTWTQAALTYDNSTSNYAFYLNGSPSGSGTWNSSWNAFVWGYQAHSWTLGYFQNQPNMRIDEWQVSNAVRSAGWIGTEYNNQSSPATFFSLGMQQPNPGGGTVAMTVTSVPVGLAVTVDGVGCAATPCTYQWTPGTPHTLAAATQMGTAGTQYVFGSWTGGAGSPDQVTAPSTATTYTATFTTTYLLTTTASPSAEGSIAPATQYFNAGSQVMITATALSGNQFVNFTGTTNSSTNPLTVTMNGPVTETANFTTISGGPGWYGTSWSDRKSITLAHGKVSGGANLTNFPVLVSLSSDANLAGTALAGGNDILFTAGDGLTLLNYEIESFTKSTGQLVAWVQIPVLSATADTTIYMYYGNASPPAPPATGLTWDTNYQFVFHMKESSGTTLGDSTAHANNATKKGASDPAYTAAGQIGGAQTFVSTLDSVNNDYATFRSATAATNTWTFEFWSNQTAINNEDVVLETATDANQSVYFYWYPANAISMRESYSPSTLEVVALNGWHHVVLVKNGSTVTPYVDGVAGNAAAVNNNTDSFTGLGYSGAVNGSFDSIAGTLDEVRLSNSNRSAGWIGTEFNNQSSPATFFSVGAQQTNPGTSNHTGTKL